MNIESSFEDVIASYKPKDFKPIKDVTKRHTKLYNDQIYEKMQLPIDQKVHGEYKRISGLYCVTYSSSL